MPRKIAVIGECMLELSEAPTSSKKNARDMTMSYGGDTLNTAIYLARYNVKVDYVTNLGDDPFSAWMVGQWLKEGVGCGLIGYIENAVPGMYLIDVDDSGERSFYYWRKNSPASKLFEDKRSSLELFSYLESYDYVFLSGISLAIMSDAARFTFLQLLSGYKSRGGTVIFDGNYRPSLWQSLDEARRSYELMYRLTDIALPTLEDESALFDRNNPEDVIARLQSLGVREIVLKMGPKGCLLATNGDQNQLIQTTPVPVIDSTAAGDSFNAGYLAARQSGLLPTDAAAEGHRLASIVIQHKGAIIPLDAMPVVG
ncbi:sugar kinase [Halioxenophilus aromaticivorans]|uniref:2-dehydro-3-deoxygluconokinase n=1 Tax=Halioxenophilus aromaticivorans TaxID=1306992 RepID=A0AAV3U3M7_9ALTE